MPLGLLKIEQSLDNLFYVINGYMIWFQPMALKFMKMSVVRCLDVAKKTKNRY